MPRFCFGKIMYLTILALFLAGIAPADEYRIGSEDILQISFWQDPELNQQVMVRQDGKITLSIIGEITAAGLTTGELADKIQKNVSLYNKKISQATVTILKFNSQKVFLAGQISNPGKMTFEVIPDLWTLIKEAGGATEHGDLTRVTIVRSEAEGGEIITVNVLEAVAKGEVDRLPKIKAGDTVEIPRMAGGGPGRQLTTDYSLERKNLFYVLGQVKMPGKVAYEQNMDIYDAIGSAGGTTEMADLKKVRLISKNGDGTTVIKLNLNDLQDQAQARRIKVKPEDTIVVGARSGAFLSWGTIRDVAAVAGTIISFVYLVQRR